MKLIYLNNVTTLKLNSELCTGCSMCLIVCPHNVFSLINKKSVIENKDSCMECGACQRNCPENAISVTTGVGCAAGIINGILNGSNTPVCNCGSGC